MADILLNSINNWETLRLANAFNEVQKERFKDPYENWHIEKKNDSTYWLFQQQISRRYTCESNISHCDTCKYWGNMHGNWNWKSPYNCPLSFIVKVEGKGSISDLCVITSFGELKFPCTVKSGQYLVYDGHARITDLNFNTIEEFYPQGAVISASSLLEGENMIGITCPFMGEGKRIPEVTVRYITRDAAEIIIP